MKTKSIPIIITLLAAGVTCLISALQHVSFAVYTKRLFLVVVSFAILGTAVRCLLDRSLKEDEEEIEVEEPSDGEEEEIFEQEESEYEELQE